jgi:hypothetical protein
MVLCVRLLNVSAPALFALLCSCTHSLRLVNEEDFALPVTEGPRQKVAVLPYEGDEANAPFHAHIVDGLRLHPSVSEVRSDWTWGANEPGFTPDIVVAAQPDVDYRGSGANFLIGFPGFFVFANAWHGYVYKADLRTRVVVYDPVTRAPLRDEALQTDWDLRHCDFGRGFWTHVGWWTPGYGAASALTALYMMSYDGDVTKPFQKEVRQPYGSFVAETILGPTVLAARDRAAEVAGVTDEVPRPQLD